MRGGNGSENPTICTPSICAARGAGGGGVMARVRIVSAGTNSLAGELA